MKKTSFGITKEENLTPMATAGKDPTVGFYRKLKQSDTARLSTAVNKVKQHNTSANKSINSTNVVKALIFLAAEDDTVAKKVAKTIREEF